MENLANLNAQLNDADLQQILSDLVPVFTQHEAWLATKFKDGAVYVTTCLQSVSVFNAARLSANKEDAERVGALTEQTLLHDAVREHVDTARRRIKRVCKMTEADNKPLSKALAASVSLGSRLQVSRLNEAKRLLEQIAAAHKTYADLLRDWGSSDAFLSIAQTLIDRIPAQSQSLRKEQSEAEAAIAARNAQAVLTTKHINTLIEAVEEFAPDEQPALFQSVSSVLNKYAAVLLSAATKQAKEAKAAKAEAKAAAKAAQVAAAGDTSDNGDAA